jgi:hypothetical protein
VPRKFRLRLAKAGENGLSIRQLCYAAAETLGVLGEEVVIEVAQWGLLCDELGHAPTAADYAARFHTSEEDAQARLLEHEAALGTSPWSVNEIQWRGAPRNGIGSLLDDVRVVREVV